MASSSDRPKRAGKFTKSHIWLALLLVLWVFVGYMLAQALLIAILWTATQLGASFGQVGQAVLSTVLSAAVYLLSLLIVLGVPWPLSH